jgi:small subunit ribosomal protein S15
MARMHSRKRGKSGSTKPTTEMPGWVTYTETEVEKLVLKYKKEGKSTSEIGMILRDKYGVPSVKAITKKRINDILEENNLKREIPEDLLNLIHRLIALKTHLEKNHKDQTAKRGLLLTDSKIRRLIKYYQKSKRLPSDWKLNRNRLKMYLE